LTDPIAVAAAHGGKGACVILPAGAPTSAGWEFAVSRRFTLLGQPRLQLHLAITGVDAEIDTSLWDVAEDGTRTLVTRGAYRYAGQAGNAAIDTVLEGNGWDFLSTHRIRLEVTQRDFPYLRTDNFPSAISYASMRLTLPTP
jgi:predicted acyl esterase